MNSSSADFFDESPLTQAQKEQELLLQLQCDILESVAINNNHTDNLNKLCFASEAMLPNAVASIMLYDDKHQHLVVRAAPSIPKAGILQLNGLIPGPQAGSCGTAVFCQEPIFVENTTADPRWVNFGKFILDFNILACWSMPLKLPDNIIIGSFALSSFEKRMPTDFQKKLLSISANLVGIILQRENMDKKLWNMAHYDSLTLLPNRTLLNERLDHALALALRQQDKVALLFLDLDNFKHINDCYGHNIGDEVLILAAKTIKRCIREQDTLSRTGGDEFILLLENVTDSIDVSKVAQKVISTLAVTPPMKGTNISLSASIGISIAPDDTSNSEELMRNADTAMYQAKKNGRNAYSFYESSLTNVIRQQLQLEAELKSALKNGEFEVFYQPQFSCQDTKLVSAEALIRWFHPERGLLVPGEFITVAEKSGLINQIGLWVLKNTCAQGNRWLDDGLKFDRLSVNLSVSQLVANCHQTFIDIADETHFPLDKLELEITESLLMEKGHVAIAELEMLNELGVSIAMDDFGTGYSSLHQIRQLPLNKVKIDRSFISELPDNKEDAILVKMIISMAKALSLQVIAEGVETIEQQQFLINEGCDLLQGYLLGKPVPVTEIERLMQTS